MEYDVKGTVLRKLEMRWTEKKMADVWNRVSEKWTEIRYRRMGFLYAIIHSIHRENGTTWLWLKIMCTICWTQALLVQIFLMCYSTLHWGYRRKTHTLTFSTASPLAYIHAFPSSHLVIRFTRMLVITTSTSTQYFVFVDRGGRGWRETQHKLEDETSSHPCDFLP
jgi:hypothetical protein